MNDFADDFLTNTDVVLTDLWEGSVFLVPTIVEVYKMFESSSTNVSYDGHVAIDGVYVNCSTEFAHQNTSDYAFMGLSILFLMIFSCLVRRTSFFVHVNNGRPGPVLPMGMLDSHDQIVEYTLAFLSVSEDIYEFMFGFKSQFGTQIPIVKFCIKLAIVILMSITSYLTFAGLHNRFLIGYVFGLVISLCYSYQGTMAAIAFSHCMAGYKILPMLCSFAAYCVIDLSLLGIFIYKLINHIRVNGLTMKEKKPNFSLDRHFCKHYVKMLFEEKCNKEIPEENIGKPLLDMLKCKKLKERIGDKVYREIPDFSLPPRLIIGISVGLFFAYRIFIDEIYSMTPTTWKFINIIENKYSTTQTNLSFAFKIVFGNISQYSLIEVRNSFRHLTFFYVHLFIGCILASIVFGFVNSIINSFLIVRNYRLNFNRLTRRGFSSMIDLNQAPAPYSLVLGFVRFSGYQAAYILWGILVIIAVMTVLLYFLIGIFLLPLVYVENSWSRRFVANYGPVLVASIILNFIQTMIVKNIFVKDKGLLMEIDNRKAFVIFSHCAFFLNAMMGMFTSLKRIIIWAFSGVVCFCRIDFSSLPNYLSSSDNGFMCYVGFIYTELYHHNPILRYFVNLMAESQRAGGPDSDILSQTEGLLEANNLLNSLTPARTLCRNKWRVAYTLVKNKSLIVYRKNNLKKIV